MQNTYYYVIYLRSINNTILIHIKCRYNYCIPTNTVRFSFTNACVAFALYTRVTFTRYRSIHS